MKVVQGVRKGCALRVGSTRTAAMLAFSTMFLLVLACLVVVTLMETTPVILLGLGEMKEGQRDLILYPRGDFLNATALSSLLPSPPLPRLSFHVTLESESTSRGATAWFMDFALEREQGLGNIGGDEPENHSFFYASEELGFKSGDKVKVMPLYNEIMWLPLYRRLEEKGESLALSQLTVFNELQTIGYFTVRETFGEARGKFGMGHSSGLVYFDIKNALHQIVRQTLESRGQPWEALLEAMKDWSFGEISKEVTVNFPNRYEVYKQAEQQQVYRSLIRFGEEVNNAVGLMATEGDMPIAQTAVLLGYFGMFIGLLLKIVIVALFVLSVLMMNNMMGIAAETKHFEFAVVKLLGASGWSVGTSLLLGSLKYVVIANFIAYPIASYSLRSLGGVFEHFFGYSFVLQPSWAAIAVATIIGVMVPICASLKPLYHILKEDLAENLLPTRSKVQAVRVIIEEKGVPWKPLLFGTTTAAFGLLTYYLLPKALIDQNAGLLLTIFFLLLEALLLGLTLFGLALQGPFEQILVYLTLWWTNETDRVLTLKNLSAHRNRNRKTSLLFALAVSLTVFFSVALSIQTQTIRQELLNQHGSYVEITSMNINSKFLSPILGSTPGVIAWSYISSPLAETLRTRGLRRLLASDKAKLFFGRVKISAVSSNFAETNFLKIGSPEWTLASAPYEPYSFLNSPSGFMTCVISSFMADHFRLQLTEEGPREFFLNLYSDNAVTRIPLNVSTVFSKRSGLFYSSIIPYSDIAVSFSTFSHLSGITDISQVPIAFARVQIDNPSNSKTIANAIREKLQGAYNVWDHRELNDTIADIDGVLNNISVALLGVVLSISFFSLITTSYINITNQTNEIGILRSLGYAPIRIIKLYIYENFVVVLASCLIGVAVGIIVALIMAVQRELFLDGDITVSLPGFSLIFIFALISSLLSSFRPLRKLLRKPITQLIRQR